ncbi:hypothetical protein B0H13DRAFT_307657 [Mycena leptocephala]|nr:hypothetical protein B0H13DRAFT_307657 [Mycena leptocephala]
MRKNDRVMLGGEGVDAGGPSVPTAGPPQIGLDGDPSEPNQDPTQNLARPQDDPNLDGETDDSSEPSEHDSDNYQDTVSIQGETEGDKKNHNVPYFQGGGGGGDPDDSGGNGGTDINGPWKEWESPIHLTKSTIELQLPNTTVKLSITSHTQFNTYPNGRDPEDVGRPFHQRKMYRPQAQAHTVLEVARGVWAPDIVIDRSYVVLGLQAHRPNSILRSENLDCDFSAPSQIYKNALSKNTVKTLAASLGGVNFGAPPTLGVTTTYSKAEARMKEATDTKPMPQWVATHQVGSVEEIGQTSFASVD